MGQAAISFPKPATLDRPQPGALPAMILLIAVNFLNYVDRQVLSAVEPEIHRTLFPPGHTSEEVAGFLMGLLSTAFIVTYMIAAPIFARLAERMSYWWVVGIGVCLWSLASGASGLPWPTSLTGAFWLLLVTRLFVGVGEGGYGPIAPTMISDFYPLKHRARMLSFFYLAIPIGGAFGYAFGEMVTNWFGKDTEGWRWAFYLVMPPGLLLAAVCFFMREPKRGAADGVTMSARRMSWRDYLALLKIPSFTLCCLGMTGMSFALGGLAYWMPAFLEGRLDATASPEARDALQRAMDPLGIGERTTFGALTALAGLAAILIGGLAGDWLRGKVPGAYFIVSGVAMTLGFPMLLLFLWTPFPGAWIFGFLTVFCLFVYTGPCNAILADVTHPSECAAGFALNIFIIHALGDAISPPIIGFIKGRWGMDTGFIVVSAFMSVGGLLWLYGARFLDRDTKLAPKRMGGEPIETAITALPRP